MKLNLLILFLIQVITNNCKEKKNENKSLHSNYLNAKNIAKCALPIVVFSLLLAKIIYDETNKKSSMNNDSNTKKNNEGISVDTQAPFQKSNSEIPKLNNQEKNNELSEIKEEVKEENNQIIETNINNKKHSENDKDKIDTTIENQKNIELLESSKENKEIKETNIIEKLKKYIQEKIDYTDTDDLKFYQYLN